MNYNKKICSNIDFKIFKLNEISDKRGSFIELFNIKKKISEEFNVKIKQISLSKSKKNVLRGFHFQKKKAQGQFLYVLKGKIFDVILNINKKSKNYRKHKKIVLDQNENKIIYMSKHCAHAFYTLSKEAWIIYFQTELYYKKYDSGFYWDDKKLNIKWPKGEKILSEKDKNLKFFHEIIK